MLPYDSCGTQTFNYIQKKKAYETEYVGQYKVKKAYSFFKSGMVRKIYVCSVEHGKILKTMVTLSQRISDRKHSLRILFNKTSDIVTLFCTCTAGFSCCINQPSGCFVQN